MSEALVAFDGRVGLVLRELRKQASFAELPRGPWLAFMAIACHWQADTEGCPGQATIVKFSGYSLRAVRDAVGELERRQLVLVRRRRDPRGFERTEYAPGPATLAALGALDGCLPANGMAAAAGAGGSPPTAAIASGSAASTAATSRSHRQEWPSLVEKNKKKKLLLLEGVEGEPAGQPSETPSIAEADRAAARVVLAECFQLQHPHFTPPRLLDEADVERVAFCAAAIDGDPPSKLQALRDSLAGAARASRRSNGSPPTVRYIWGRLEHFLRHAERGRSLRSMAERQTCLPMAPQAPGVAPAAPHVGPSRSQMEADLAKLFGSTWRQTR
ncbi:MAG TPA: hypothetical protein VGL81_23995 [Polyangiaceae bacterium]|jgi:hypothetical protein